MKFRDFGSSNKKVSEVGMGCWAIGGNTFGNSYGKTDDVVSVKTVKKALELGCNFFDTADVYGNGHSEEILGLCLRKARDFLAIATKVGGSYMYGGKWGHMNFSEEYIRFALEQSMARLQTDYIDIYQLHNPPIEVIKEGKVFEVLDALKKEGKIKFSGISIHSLEEGEAALKHKIDSIQLVFNMLDPRKYEIMEAARVKGVAVISREPLANGFLSGKLAGKVFEKGDIRNQMPPQYIENMVDAANELKEMFSHRKESLAQLAIKYVLSSNSVSVTIPGAKTPEQVEENLKASDIPDFSEKDLSLLGS